MKNKIISVIFIFIFSLTLSGCVDIFGNYNNLSNVTYQVTFDLQGGEGLSTTTASVKGGERFPSQGNFDTSTLQKDGYTFNGWYDKVNGSGTRYDYIESVENNITLYADWNLINEEPNVNENEVQITFISGMMPELSVIVIEQGSRAPESGTFIAPQLEGYLFLGWYYNSLFSGTSVDYIESVTENTTLYAKWLRIDAEQASVEVETIYVVTFDSNGGLGTMQNQTFKVEESKALLSNSYLPPEENYVFAGWATTPSGEVVYENKAAFTATDNITLYAIWTKGETYLISFNGSGATGTMNNYLLAAGSQFMVPACGFTSPYGGVSCAGWATTFGGSVVYRTDDIITITNSLNLYAVWQVNIYLSFNANGGTGTMSSQLFYANQSKAVSKNTFIAPSQTKKFAGWATSASGAVVCQDEGIYSIKSATTFYAIWANKAIYTVIFNNNGGRGEAMPNQQIEEGLSIKLNANTFYPPASGIAFGGWSLSATGPVAYINEQEVVLTSSVTLYAKWVASTTATLTFQINDGRTNTYTYNVLKNTPVRIPANEFSASYGGVAFTGWATSPNGEVVYTNKEIATFTANTTLYAKWSVLYKVYLNSDGNRISTLAGFKGTRVPSTGIFITPTKEGAVFGGWYTQVNGGGTKYSYIDNINGELNLYAHWINKYTTGLEITVHLELGYDDLFLTEKGVYNTRIPSTGNFITPVREDYQFMGWYTGIDGFGNSLNYIQSATKNTTLYAYWRYVGNQTQVSIILDSQGGSTLSDVTVTYGQRAPLSGSLPNPYKSGYIFKGWYNKADGAGTQYSYIANLNTNIILYAYWQLDTSNNYTINFNSMGGDSVVNCYAVYGKRAPTTGNFTVPTRTGYNFMGWFTQVNGQGTKQEFITSLKSDIVLYAHWQIKTYTVIFDCEGGYGMSSLTGNYNARIPSTGYFSEPTRSGYVFMGWFTEDNGNGLYRKYIKNLNNNVTLYARWDKINSSVERAESNYLHNKTIELNFTDFDASGYIQNQGMTNDFKYGKYYSDYNGCGWIATYNALRYLQIQGLYEDEIVIADIIRYYDHYGLFLEGTFGTQYTAIETYFKELGFTVNRYSNTDKFDQAIKEADVSITWFLIGWKGHYQSISYDEDTYKFYNCELYYNSYDEYMEELGTGIYYVTTITAS